MLLIVEGLLLIRVGVVRQSVAIVIVNEDVTT